MDNLSHRTIGPKLNTLVLRSENPEALFKEGLKIVNFVSSYRPYEFLKLLEQGHSLFDLVEDYLGARCAPTLNQTVPCFEVVG